MSAPRGITWALWPLGLFSDTLIAENIGCTSTAVFFARCARHIPACRFPRRRGLRGIDWGKWPLGLMSDRVIAENAGCDFTTVHQARRVRGIPPFRDHRPRCDRKQLAPLLGAMPDRVVAEILGLSVSQVFQARSNAGISSTRNKWDEVELGAQPDKVVADRFGVGHTVVAGARWRRGIGKWKETRKCPCGISFVAKQRRQRFCSHDCGRYWWLLVKKYNALPEVANVRTGLRAYKRSMKGRG